MTRRTNRERADATRADLIRAGRALFAEKSYAETATPEIVEVAGVTRGALYHHFADKQALFRAVVEAEARLVAGEIDAASVDARDPVEALAAGGAAFMRAMKVPGRARLLLLDGPAVLGRAAMDDIDARDGSAGALRAGLAAAMEAGALTQVPLGPLTALLSAAFDRAALAVAEGGDAATYHKALEALLEGLRLQ